MEGKEKQRDVFEIVNSIPNSLPEDLGLDPEDVEAYYYYSKDYDEEDLDYCGPTLLDCLIWGEKGFPTDGVMEDGEEEN